ncbi:hypothetical protein EUU23_08775 [Sphingorhabdus sp. IMCC26285]|uniref:Uncharacterized protein n=1 Tax=Sphingorhabdus profundilacus TaxID=2509718 RepID=A0A6I4LY36_9SPHN|nr:hypothetical protein [Sphingorhabdus profundilacus]MVZ97799.1 hypothetical protein [Sphingorhabdus profundilacus]
MDHSSRNIVSFIATITVAALILMGAHFYAESKAPPTVASKEAPVAKHLPENATPATAEDLADAAFDFAEEEDAPIVDSQINLEKPETITGEPSIAIQAANQAE